MGDTENQVRGLLMKIANIPTIPHPVILSWCKRVLSSDDLGAGRNLSGASIPSRWWRDGMRAGKFLIESIKNQFPRRHRRGGGGSIELEQMVSADPPLAVHSLYGGRHRQWRRRGTGEV